MKRLAGEFVPSLLALLALLAALGFALTVRERAADVSGLVQQTLLVREAGERLLGFVRDAETGQRGYVITGDPAFLAPFETAQPAAEAELRRMQRMVRGDAAQLARLQRMQAGIDDKFAELRRTVALVRAGEGAAAVAIVRDGSGRRLMERLRAQAEEFKADESRRLAVLQAEAAAEGAKALIAFRLAIAALVVAAMVQVAQWRHRAGRLREQAAVLANEVAARTAALEMEQVRIEALLADVNHRVGNDLAAVGVLLAMQARRSEAPEVKEALKDAQDRVRMIAEAQRRLRLDVGTDTVMAGHVLEPALEMLGERLGERGIAVEHSIADVPMPGRDALSLVIIVNELVTNAAKHAFPDGFAGAKRIGVSLANAAAGLQLAVADSGAGFAMDAGKGMGTNVVSSLARGMGAELRREAAEPGTRVVLHLGRVAAA